MTEKVKAGAATPEDLAREQSALSALERQLSKTKNEFWTATREARGFLATITGSPESAGAREEFSKIAGAVASVDHAVGPAAKAAAAAAPPAAKASGGLSFGSFFGRIAGSSGASSSSTAVGSGNGNAKESKGKGVASAAAVSVRFPSFSFSRSIYVKERRKMEEREVVEWNINHWQRAAWGSGGGSAPGSRGRSCLSRLGLAS